MVSNLNQQMSYSWFHLFESEKLFCQQISQVTKNHQQLIFNTLTLMGLVFL